MSFYQPFSRCGLAMYGAVQLSDFFLYLCRVLSTAWAAILRAADRSSSLSESPAHDVK